VILWLVRHARPLIESGICYGALDVAADRQSTEDAAHLLAEALPRSLPVRVSPARRCQQLAEALARLRGDLQFATDLRLAEMDFGQWEGVGWDQIPRAAMESWTADFGDHRFGGKESANEVIARVAEVWDAARGISRDDMAVNSSGALQGEIWITHAGVIRAAGLIASGRRTVTHATDWPADAPAYGAWIALRAEHGGVAEVL
jgi:alpha-ribazole phosphatase